MKELYARLLFLPTYSWNVLLGRVLKHRRWWDYVDPMVILGARPMHRDLKGLYAAGVRGMVNMCEEFPGPVAAYKTLGIEQLWLPTTDFQPPSLAHVTQGVDFIEKLSSRGDKVYVHCKAGRARSATVVICWLVKHRKMSITEAQEHLIACRPHVHPRLADRSVVREYLREHGFNPDGTAMTPEAAAAAAATDPPDEPSAAKVAG